VDTETTGISSKEDQVIQIGAYEPYSRKSIELNIMPTIDIKPRAFSTHKISKEWLRKNSPLNLKEAWLKFLVFIDSFESTPVLVFHNRTFDWNILKNNLSKISINPPGNWETFCSLQYIKRLLPNRKNNQKYKEKGSKPWILENLAKDFKILTNKTQTHHALDGFFFFFFFFFFLRNFFY
jgi:DNA polymerase III epsilon subunit-like protein